MNVVFIAELEVPESELEKAEGATIQAIQNMIGSTGAQVITIEFEDV